MNFEKICRACGVTVGNKRFCVNLFQKHLEIKFKECTAVDLNENDGLPSNLCKPCHNALVSFHEFRIKCKESDTTFKRNIEKKSRPKCNPNSTKLSYRKENSIELQNNESNKIEHIIDHSDKSIEIQETQNIEPEITEEDDLDHSKHSKSTDEEQEQLSKSKSVTTRGLQKSLPCPIENCNRKFYLEHKLHGHIRQHNGQKPALCTYCGKEYMRFSVLNAHIDTVHRKKLGEHVCQYEGCGKAYTFKHILNSHIKMVHTKELTKKKKKKIHICELCGKSVTSSHALKNHLMTHTGNMPFLCPKCPRKFTARNKLKVHMMRHNGIKNFTCPHCGLQKTTMPELRIHMNYHTKEKMYPCSFCDAVFAASANRVRHIKIVHEGIKAYECSICKRSFGKKETLKHHFMTHTGEKPHECTICRRRFIQVVALQTHMKVHDKKKIKNIL